MQAAAARALGSLDPLGKSELHDRIETQEEIQGGRERRRLIGCRTIRVSRGIRQRLASIEPEPMGSQVAQRRRAFWKRSKVSRARGVPVSVGEV